MQIRKEILPIRDELRTSDPIYGRGRNRIDNAAAKFSCETRPDRPPSGAVCVTCFRGIARGRIPHKLPFDNRRVENPENQDR